MSGQNDHKSEKSYCMKAYSVRDQPKIDHIAEKTIYPKTIYPKPGVSDLWVETTQNIKEPHSNSNSFSCGLD